MPQGQISTWSWSLKLFATCSTRLLCSLLAITIWLWHGHFGSKSGPGPFGVFWQLQFGCEMATLDPNLDLGLLEPSSTYNLAVKLPFWFQTWTSAFWNLLAVKWQFWLQIWNCAFWSLLAITIWLWNCHFGSKPGPGPFEVFWQLQFGCEMAIFAPNRLEKAPKRLQKVPKGSKRLNWLCAFREGLKPWGLG